MNRATVFASIDPGYSGVRHFVLVNAMALPVIVWALAQVRAPGAAELCAVPIALTLANYGEWALHRYLLHRRVPGFHVLFQRHAVMHHSAFRHDLMAAPSSREWRWVLFPAPALLGLLALVGPICLGMARLVTANVGALLLASFVGFYLLYEWCHLAYHQPEHGVFGRSQVLRWLRLHHQRHHHPRFARSYNFNVTVPLFDWVRGTDMPPHLCQVVDAEARHPADDDAEL